MKTRIADHENQYLQLFANCFLVKGYTRSMICDTQQMKQYFFSNDFAEVLNALQEFPIGQVFRMLEDKESEQEFQDFVEFLIEMNLAIIVGDLQQFPRINLEWHHPSKIVNSIIDIRNVMHDFRSIFRDLDALGCYFIQVRSYISLSKKDILAIVTAMEDKAFRYVHIFSKYENSLDLYIDLEQSFRNNPFVAITIHSTPGSRLKEIKQFNKLTFLEQNIDSCATCGIINEAYVSPVSLDTFLENINYNGCLNRKISIDEEGNIKNCPSMAISYGNIAEKSLIDVIEDSNFQSLWNIKKDDILVCKDCEYRYVCTDCRAYTQEGNILGKPSKCKYDPYTGSWAN